MEVPATQIIVLAVLIVVLVAVPLLIARTGESIGRSKWFRQVRPAATPPGAVFGIVWTLLYIGLAIAAWLVWRQHGVAATRPLVIGALIVFGLQMLGNWAWTPLFQSRRPRAALYLLLTILVLSLACAFLFARVSPVAGAIVGAYIGWLIFALYMNAKTVENHVRLGGERGSI